MVIQVKNRHLTDRTYFFKVLTPLPPPYVVYGLLNGENFAWPLSRSVLSFVTNRRQNVKITKEYALLYFTLQCLERLTNFIAWQLFHTIYFSYLDTFIRTWSHIHMLPSKFVDTLPMYIQVFHLPAWCILCLTLSFVLFNHHLFFVSHRAQFGVSVMQQSQVST